MRDKPYRLAMFWGLYNDRSDRPDDLATFATREDLDTFTRKFKSNKELRAFFDQEIGESALNNMAKIKKVDEIKKQDKRVSRKEKPLPGRLSAYYFDDKGKMHFIEIAYQDRKIIRDYREFETLKKRKLFFETLLNELEKLLFKVQKDDEKPKKQLSVNEKMFVVMEMFEKYGYMISDNEKYYLKGFLFVPTTENRKKFLGFVNLNLQDEMNKEKKEKPTSPEKFSDDEIYEAKYEIYDLDDKEFAIIFEKAIKKQDFSELFKYYTSEEIAKKSNYFEIQGKRRNLCIK